VNPNDSTRDNTAASPELNDPTSPTTNNTSPDTTVASGVTGFDGSDGDESPTAFDATTVKV